MVTVSASDADEGANGEVTYEFSRISDEAKDLFSLDRKTGEIRVTGPIDFEEKSRYEMRIEGKDGAGLASQTKVIVDITDVNDNAPVISVTSLSNSVPESAPPGTEVGIINVQDIDSDDNSKVRCSIQGQVPFKLTAFNQKLLFDCNNWCTGPGTPVRIQYFTDCFRRRLPAPVLL